MKFLALGETYFQKADVMGAKALSTHAQTLQEKSIDTASHTNSVVQHYFTAKGDKAKKVRQWVSAPKKQLEAEGEDLLLKFFTDHAKSDVEVEWDNVRETYGSSKGELGQGFYTVTGHEDGAAEGIRNEFGEKGKEPRDVLKFRIANVELIEMVR